MLGRAVIENGRDEGAVDFQLVELEFAQTPERRLAGAEIIKRHAHARIAQIVTIASAVTGSDMTPVSVISISSRFGSNPVLLENGQNRLAGVGILQLYWRQIERQEHVLRPTAQQQLSPCAAAIASTAR